MSSNANSTVLARKWRPKQFSELVGQSHVMQALANALDQKRLHHAYLFTGTRGVGKTTIARIFSKALNCEQGISSTPCGVCNICRSIDEGRFIDLIEVDAASRTKVDDTREILDNVQFAPTQGRYKVYLIDEVHMLSKSSFNALLKTLEEPPEHVKFLLATTDPHKLPVTVLSRCLQFNLVRLTPLQIQTHLEFIMTQEALPFEKSALGLIAKGADGSARDALSLLDQAIAYGAGEVLFEPVQTMLGLVDQQYSVSILTALANEEPDELKEVIQQLAVMGVNYQALLTQLIETLHALSYCQIFGDSSVLSTLPQEVIVSLAEQLEPERIQLLYQIALLANQDMLLAPDSRIGFEMTLIRMLAFQPVQLGSASQSSVKTVEKRESSQVGGGDFSQTNQQESVPHNALEGALKGLASARSLMAQKTESSSIVKDVSATQQGGGEFLEAPSSNTQTMDVASSSDHLSQIKARLKQPLGKLNTALKEKVENTSFQTSPSLDVSDSSHFSSPPQASVKEEKEGLSDSFEESGGIEQWLDIITRLPLKGMAAEVARNSVLVKLTENEMAVSIDPEQNYSKQEMALLQFEEAVKQCYGKAFKLNFVTAGEHFTPVKYEQQQMEQRQQKACCAIEQDEHIQALQQVLGMQVVPGSIKPI